MYQILSFKLTIDLRENFIKGIVALLNINVLVISLCIFCKVENSINEKKIYTNRILKKKLTVLVLMLSISAASDF